MNRLQIHRLPNLKGIRLAKDILVAKLDEFSFYKNEINSVYDEIDTKGIVLWQKSI